MSGTMHGRPLPGISVLVCTRDRAQDLERCLAGLQHIDYARFEVIVIDSASRDRRIRAIVQDRGFRYVREDCPGLDLARNRGIAEARYDIIAYIDDDAIPDTQWLRATASAFARHEVGAVTGLVLPLDQETRTQQLSELYGNGMARGSHARRIRADGPAAERIATQHIGVGTNMAFRRTALNAVGGFDPQLDAGTPTGGAGDLDMFHRVLAAGFDIQYQPSAIVWHRQHRTMPELEQKLHRNGRSFGVYLLKLFGTGSVSRLAVLRYTLLHWLPLLVGRLVLGVLGRHHLPVRLLAAELAGAATAPFAYAALRHARANGAVPASGSPLPAALRRAQPQPALILLYHSIAERAWDPWDLCVSPRHFAEHMDVLATLSTPIRLADWRSGFTGNRPAVAVTFDDGYSDNLTAALPILRARGIPATLFPIAPHSAPTAEFWWDELDRLLLSPGLLPDRLVIRLPDGGLLRDINGKYTIEDAERQRDWRAFEPPPTARHALYLELWRRLRDLPDSARQHVLAELFALCDVPRLSRPGHRRFSAKQLAQLSAERNIDIGAHTLTHPPLARLARMAQRAEIQESKLHLEAIIGRSVSAFSYPFGKAGDYSPLTKQLVQQAGCMCAVSNVAGPLLRSSDPFELPRVHVPDLGGAEFEAWLFRQLSETHAA
jgi:peptidoglycan/xylan/chitin deacetylase (PgdA/CDA1 family)/GT2 family glycosyltransferase